MRGRSTPPDVRILEVTPRRRDMLIGADVAVRDVTDSTACSNAVFGDPAPGMAQICFVQ
jgi:hypothetical protein